ncbi:6-phosphogluconolactonase [Thiothrix eikelboomii]|uniref:6-phosphogluconolactonase n=1 Tax=Thiothrix eikelboomii TaxID=92487 RepID=A0A1T4WA78_9GAMM|nr:6-phosphogluconolactonase [Thiothrix eikelboomii]SKA74234.1 6-phosphogluconolactonase [Thiothrix eikelboomii]
MNLVSYADRALQAEQLAQLVASELQQAVASQDKASAAFAGGTTPVLFFKALSKQAVDWSKLRITLTDERQVEPNHERSNALLLTNNLLANLQPPAHFQALYQLGQTATELASLSLNLQQQFFPLDVVVLGMGNDGHFASLFPHAPNLAAGLDPDYPDILLEIRVADLPEARISMSLAALLQAKHLHLLITGADKKQLLEQAQTRIAARLPVQWPIEALLQQAGDSLTVHYAP